MIKTLGHLKIAIGLEYIQLITHIAALVLFILNNEGNKIGYGLDWFAIGSFVVFIGINLRVLKRY